MPIFARGWGRAGTKFVLYGVARRGAGGVVRFATMYYVQERMRRRAVFFDRDGVLNVDCGYIGSVDRFIWMAGAREAVRLANARGFLVFVVTNQSGVARGLYDEAAVRALHDHMQADLNAIGGRVDEFCYCPHLPGAARSKYALDCDCRKPKPGMICNLVARWRIDADRSLLIGDKQTDMDAAAGAGIRGEMFAGGDLAGFLAAALDAEAS